MRCLAEDGVFDGVVPVLGSAFFLTRISSNCRVLSFAYLSSNLRAV